MAETTLDDFFDNLDDAYDVEREAYSNCAEFDDGIDCEPRNDEAE